MAKNKLSPEEVQKVLDQQSADIGAYEIQADELRAAGVPENEILSPPPSYLQGGKTDFELQDLLDKYSEKTKTYEIQVEELRRMGLTDEQIADQSREPQSVKQKLSPEEVQRVLDQQSYDMGTYEIQADELREMGIKDEDLLSPPPREFMDRAPQSIVQPKKTLTSDEVRRALMEGNMSGSRSDLLAENLGDGPITALSAMNTMDAAGEFYGKEHGWLENTFYTLNMPQQFVARQTVNILENAGALSTDEARDILARDQVNGSDIVNFYWKDPETWYGKTGRFATGLAADILLDPLSYVGFGALKQAAKSTVIGGKAINLGKMSKAERAYFNTLEGVEKVVKSDAGKVEMLIDGHAIDVAKRNEMAIARARDQIIGFDELQTTLGLSPQAKEEALSQIRVGMTEKSWAKEWREGSRGLTFGARIPFTDVAFEVDMPGHISKLASLPVVALDGTFDFGRSLIRSTGLGDAAFNLVSDLGTRTGKFIFDVQQNVRLGSKSVLRQELGEFEKRANVFLNEKKTQLGSEKFSQFISDITDELEMGLKSVDEAEDLAQTFKYTGDLDFLISPSTADSARAMRLAQNPGAMDLVSDMRAMMDDMVFEYKSRGLPFEELNPFGEGWARSYIKHEVSDDFIRKFREVDQASDVIGAAMAKTPQLMGKVDTSALGRKYRGTIREANEASLEEYGVKMFVDNPVELISRRMEEMHKVVQDHDLLEAALPYAVRGKNPGVGYVKYNPDDFRRLSIDQSDQFGTKWDSFIPQGMKASESLYFPEDVYDRMLFNINGWNKSKSLNKVMNAADFYTNVWRNNALFGPGYIGLNAFSNALTYLSFNDHWKAPINLAKASGILTPWGKNIEITSQYGKLSGEKVFQMALEDNLLRSSFNKPIRFSDFAEHVSSNREARQRLGQKVESVMDTAFLWRYSRGLAQFGDETPKLATYIDRLEKGFTRQAAAEAAERYFYNFNNMGRVQTAVSTAIPFSSFPMKTAEMVLEHMKTGRLAQLAIPGKVQAALDGAFVQDHETRGALDQMLPMYRNVLHPIHGEIMPGMREVLVDVPWSFTTMATIFNPEDSNHPVLQIFQLAGAAKSATEDMLGLKTEMEMEDALEAQRSTKYLFNQNLDLFIPSYMREAMTLAEINGAFDFGGYFKDRYAPTLPTRSQVDRGEDEDRTLLDQSSVYHRFNNAADFGQAMDEKYGENWLYNLAFSNRPDDPTEWADKQDQGARGEYVRRKMRQFTLGLATMTKLDSNFFMNAFAIKRQMDQKTKDIKSKIIQSGALVDVERVTDEEYLKNWADTYPEAKEILSLKYKREALLEYYNFFLEQDHNMPEVDLLSILFGTKEFAFDYGEKPEKEVYQQLYRRKNKASIEDFEADELMQDIYDKESLE